MTARWIVLVLYLALMIGIGVYYRRKSASVNDFVLGGRGLGAWFTAFAYGTSYFSAVIFVGYAGKFGWNYGVASTWVGIGNAVIGSWLAWKVLGRRTRIMSKHLEAKTMPEYFEKRYNSKPLKIVSALIVFVFLIPYTASVYNGLSRLFEKGFGIPYKYCIIGMAVFTAVYVIMGGYKATALNDFIQGIVMLVGIAAVVLAVLGENGGLGNSLDLLGDIPDANGDKGAYSSLFGPDRGFDGIVPTMMEKLPSLLFGLVIVLVLSASMSTLSSLVLTSSSTLTIDLIKPIMKERMDEKKQLITMRIFIAVFLIISVVLAIITLENPQTVISTLMSISWGALAGAFLAPFMYGLFWKGVTKAACMASFIAGVGITVVHMAYYTLAGHTGTLWGINLASPINAGAFAMLFGLVLVPIVSLITRQSDADKAHAEKVFECYNDSEL